MKILLALREFDAQHHLISRFAFLGAFKSFVEAFVLCRLLTVCPLGAQQASFLFASLAVCVPSLVFQPSPAQVVCSEYVLLFCKYRDQTRPGRSSHGRQRAIPLPSACWLSSAYRDQGRTTTMGARLRTPEVREACRAGQEILCSGGD